MALTEVNSLGIKALEVKTGDIAADAIDGTKLADNACDSEHYTDGSIDHVHLAADAVDGDNIADDSINSEHYVDGSIDTAHIADNQITLAKMAGGTDGQIITYDASGDPVAVGPGTDGQVLTSTGAGSPPAFETLPSGGVPTNLIINGAFQIAQRATTSTGGNIKTVDRFSASINGEDEAFTQAQVDVTADSAPWNLGFRKAFQITNGNQTGGADVGDFCQMRTQLEAQDIANSGWDYTSASSYVTLSFWVKSSVAQNFYGHIQTVDGSVQTYAFETGSLSADTWTKITKTIPGAANVQMDNNNDGGFNIYWWQYIDTGKTDSGVSLNTWGAYNGSARTPDATSTWWTTNDATFAMTGVQLEVGNSASDYAHKSYGDELLRCFRYYYKASANNNEFFPGMGMADTDGNTVILNTQFPVRMRSAPSALEQTGTASDYKIRRSTTATCSSNPAFGHATVDQAATNLISSSHGFGDGSAVRGMSGATDAYLAWSAEF